MKLQIRPATREDVPAVLGMIRELADFEKLSHEVMATEEGLGRAFFPDAGPPAAECVLAVDGSETLGYAITFTSFSTFLARPGLYLEDLYVKPAHRKRGIGRAMMVHLAGLAARRGYGRMEWTVLDWNTPAIGFYDSLGARTLPDWRTCRLTGEALARYA
jgi:GNAT superfamily N-acetyltransferase